MKKLASLLMVMVLAILFFSCEKGTLGEYKPKMKIDKIYSETEPRYLKEQWTWNGDFLSRIDYFRRSGSVEYSQNYVYEGKRLARIEMDGQHSEFLYDGDKLTTINTYDGDRKVESYQLSYDKKKLSHVSIENDLQAKRCAVWSPLSLFVPVNQQISTISLATSDSKREKYDFSNAEIDFVWDGDNVQYMKMQLTRPDSIQRLVFSYVYDQKLNPMNGFFILNVDHQMLNDQPHYTFCSKNNILSVMMTDQYDDVFSRTRSYTYSYDYYQNFPTKVYSTFVNIETLKEDSTLIYSYQYLY